MSRENDRLPKREAQTGSARLSPQYGEGQDRTDIEVEPATPLENEPVSRRWLLRRARQKSRRSSAGRAEGKLSTVGTGSLGPQARLTLRHGFRLLDFYFVLPLVISERAPAFCPVMSSVGFTPAAFCPVCAVPGPPCANTAVLQERARAGPRAYLLHRQGAKARDPGQEAEESRLLEGQGRLPGPRPDVRPRGGGPSHMMQIDEGCAEFRCRASCMGDGSPPLGRTSGPGHTTPATGNPQFPSAHDADVAPRSQSRRERRDRLTVAGVVEEVPPTACDRLNHLMV
ncbi:hypothetical protein J2X36_000827 [Methylobacterium sp. BE186]|nr:hypothetical protein [Methylobacterium sp. BE186]